MNSEERFRNSLEDLINSRNFDFDEQNWDKARQMIDASKKRKRRLFPYIVASFLLGTALLSGLYYLVPDSAPVKQTATHPSANSTALTELNKTPELPVDAPLAQTAVPQPETLRTEPVQETPALRTPEPVTPRSGETTAPETHPATAQAQPVTPAPGTPSKTAPVKTAGPDPLPETNANPVASHDPTAPEKQEPADIVPAPLVIPTPETTPEPEPVVKAENTTSAASGDTKNSTPAADVARTEANSRPENTQAANEEIAAATPVTQDAPHTAQPENTDKKTDAPRQPASSEQVVADELNPKTELLPLLARPDSVKESLTSASSLIPADNDQGQLGKPKKELVLFSVEAGANYMYGWQNPGTRDASGFNPQIGVNLFNNLRPDMSVSFGIHYTTVSKLSYSNYTSRVIRRGLGEESEITVFTPTKVHYLVAPLRFNYTPGLKNTFGVGCNVAYLLNVESDVERYMEKLNTIYDRSISKAVGYTEGFKKYDVQVSAFYKRRLYPNLALNLEVFYGLTDVKNNTLFNSNVVERNSGLRLTLVYNVLKK